MRGYRWLVYTAAGLVLILAAGCGWQTGPTFQGEFDPGKNDPVTAVQKWFASMEWPKTEGGEGQVVVDRDKGRDFDLFLEVVNPDFLRDPNGEPISPEELENLREMWNSKDWEIEFRDIVLEEVSREDDEAVVKIVAGKVRYIGKEMFGTSEYKEDDFADKGGEIYLEWYDDPANDPLLRLAPEKAVPRWVVVGGLDLSEEKGFGEFP